MPEDIDSNVIKGVRSLYKENEAARRFLDHCAERERDASETSVDRIAYRLDVSREAAIGLAQDLEEAGCGSFVVGRRGYKSRFVWDYSCISVGQVASGEAVALEEPANAIEEVVASDIGSFSAQDTTLTIAQAKIGLAKGLGVAVEAIRITIES